MATHNATNISSNVKSIKRHLIDNEILKSKPKATAKPVRPHTSSHLRHLHWLAYLRDRKASRSYRKKMKWAYMLRHKLSRRLNSIKSRCLYPTCNRYASYGGKGIECRITLNELEFLYHRDNAAEMAEPSVDRIDPNGHYEYSNCRWMELKENRLRKASSPDNPTNPTQPAKAKRSAHL